jgi:hypothetical protein
MLWTKHRDILRRESPSNFDLLQYVQYIQYVPNKEETEWGQEIEQAGRREAGRYCTRRMLS